MRPTFNWKTISIGPILVGSAIEWCLNIRRSTILSMNMMVGSLRSERKIFSILRTKSSKKRTIIVGLKSDNYGREMLLRSLNVVVKPGDNVLAIHVQQPLDNFDANTFHMHEDLCKSKQVDFLIKICNGNCFISELSNQVRINFATILVLGCNLSRPKDSVISNYLKGLPPTCSLLIINKVGKIILERQGTSQQGSSQSFHSSLLSEESHFTPNSSSRETPIQQIYSTKKYSLAQKLFRKLVQIESERSIKLFTLQDLNSATDNFSPDMVIGEGGHSKVYRAKLEDGRPAAVKVLQRTQFSAEDLLREVEILSSLKHENIVRIIGYCENMDINAVVYNLLKGSLNQNLKQLKWKERMGVAIGVAKALDYLHHSFNPPIIHRDVKSSNILLSDDCQPQLSDFGAAMFYNKTEQISENINVVGTFGYLAPEYVMYGKVDEKIDVYSYGVVLLELVSGKEAIQTNQKKQESLVLWARSLINSGLPECLIDPCLSEDYVVEDMKMVMFIARLCLMHSSSRRPTMKMILRLFEERKLWQKLQRERDETYPWSHNDFYTNTTLSMDELCDEILLLGVADY